MKSASCSDEHSVSSFDSLPAGLITDFDFVLKFSVTETEACLGKTLFGCLLSSNAPQQLRHTARPQGVRVRTIQSVFSAVTLAVAVRPAYSPLFPPPRARLPLCRAHVGKLRLSSSSARCDSSAKFRVPRDEREERCNRRSPSLEYDESLRLSKTYSQ